MSWQAADGEPFRFIFYDGDGCFSKIGFDAWGNATDSIWHFSTSSPGATLFFRRFLQNKVFKDAFVSRYYELKDTHLSFESMHSYWQQYRDEVSCEIQNVVDRFGFPVSYTRWAEDMEKCDDFLEQRNELFANQLLTIFDVGEDVAVTWSCFPNPFEDEFVVELPNYSEENGLLQIFDINGRECYRQELSSLGERVQIKPSIPSGMYLLRIGNVSQVVVKE